jgi:hypothetical protein
MKSMIGSWPLLIITKTNKAFQNDKYCSVSFSVSRYSPFYTKRNSTAFASECDVRAQNMKCAIFLLVFLSGCMHSGNHQFVMPQTIDISDEIDAEQATNIVEYLLENSRTLKKNNERLKRLDFNEITSITKPIVFSERAVRLFTSINSHLDTCIMSVNWESGFGKTAACIALEAGGNKDEYTVSVYYSSSH